MTEAEAKTKWCPFVRFAMHEPTEQIAANRSDDAPSTSWNKCIAADCMAWRTRHQWLDNAQETPDWVSYAPYAFGPGEGQERDDGYCGLAGEPR